MKISELSDFTIIGCINELHLMENRLKEYGFNLTFPKYTLHNPMPKINCSIKKMEYSYSPFTIGEILVCSEADMLLRNLNNLKTNNMKTNELEVEINGNKVTIALTDEQIKQLQTQQQQKREWWKDAEFDSPYMLVSNDCGNVSYYDANHKLQMEIYRLYPRFTFNGMKQAENAAKYINLFIEMYNFAQLRNGKNKIDWTNCSQHKFGLIYNLCMDKFKCLLVDVYSTSNPFVFGLALLSREHAEEMLSIFGDRIKAVYLKLQNY